MRVMLIALVLASALLFCACDKKPAPAGTNSNANSSRLKIAVIPKGTTHVYWKSVEAGARQAAGELGVDIVWKGPLKENDRAQQMNIVEQFVGDKVSAIVLAPLDDEALLKPVQEAAGAKIPVVIIDSGLKGELGKDFVSFIATDNHHGGVMAGEKLADLLGHKGKVVLLRYQVGSASTQEREEGFLEVMRKNPDVRMLVDDQYGGATASEAQNAATNMLGKLREADGIFCPNESSTFGMLLALKQTGLAGKARFVGFDATPQLTEAMTAGEIDALVAQDPVKMGYEGVKTAVAAIRGQPVQKQIDTGVRLLTKADLAKADVQKLLGQ